MRRIALLCAIASLLGTSVAEAAPSGEDMPVGNLQGWRQVLTEDFPTDVGEGSFPGTAYGPRHEVYGDTVGNGFAQAPSRILSVQGGLLTWSFRDNAQGLPQIATVLPRLHGPGTSGYWGQTYGRYTVRIRSTSLGAGYMPVFLLWPDDDVWPAHGEVDFPAGDLTEAIRAYTVPTDGSQPYSIMSQTGWTGWHTATIEWTPGTLRYILDGAVLGTVTSGVPSTPMHWVLQTGTTDYGAPPAPGTTANLQVDWIAAWQYSPGTPASSGGTAPAGSGTPSTATRAPSATRTADGRMIVRVNAGSSCRRRDAMRVSGQLAIRAPRGARRVRVSLDGRRVRRPARLDTRARRNGMHRIAVRYRPRGGSKRVAGCRSIRIANPAR